MICRKLKGEFPLPLFRSWAKKTIEWSASVSAWKHGDSKLLLALTKVAASIEDWESVFQWGKYCAHCEVIPLLKQASLEQGPEAKAALIESLVKTKNRPFIQALA